MATASSPKTPCASLRSSTAPPTRLPSARASWATARPSSASRRTHEPFAWQCWKWPAGNDPTPADCDGGNGTWNARRGEQWINGHYANTLYNHFYGPNQAGKWDCGNASHNKGLTAARSWHTGGVNLLLCDGSIRFVTDAASMAAWRALATRAGQEVPGNL